MSISVIEHSMKKQTFIYVLVTVFCFLFAQIYNHFGHGVTSFFMSGLFLYPLVAALFSLICLLLKKRVGGLESHLMNGGVATLIAASLLKGIFDIAGTASPYVLWLFLLGAVMSMAGVVITLFRR